jgi:hypothetical protein
MPNMKTVTLYRDLDPEGDIKIFIEFFLDLSMF